MSAGGSFPGDHRPSRIAQLGLSELIGITSLYATLSDLTEVILKSSDRQSLLEQVCAIAVRQGRFRSALVWWIDPARPREATRAALAAATDEEVKPRTRIDLDADNPYSPAIHALCSGERAYCNDSRSDPRILTKPRWKSCGAFPLREQGRLAGAMVIYSHSINAFGPEELPLLGRIADDLSLALDRFLREAQQREAEQALRRSEEQMRLITDNVPVMISYIDTKSRYRFVNRAYELFFNRPRESMLGRHYSEIIDKEDYEAMRRNAMQRNQTRRRRRTMRDANGTPRFFDSIAIPEWGSDGKEVGRYVVNIEITELLQTQEALRESEERFQLAVRGSSDGIWDFNLKTGARYYSPRFKRLLGYADEELLSRYETITALMTDDDRQRVDRALCRHLHERVPFNTECRFRHRDGHWIWMRLRGQAQWDETGRATRVAGSATDITDHKVIEAKLLRQAHYDSLTGLPNRVTFQDRIEQSLQQAERNKWQVGVLFVDLDRFKQVNDSLGHAAGDELLRQVAQRLQDSLRAGDTVGRLSGDEFALLLPDLGAAETARVVAAKVIDRLSQPFHLNGQDVSIGASIGIAVAPRDGKSPEELVKHSDAAMYRAKQKGRGNLQFYSDATNSGSQQQELAQALRAALERGELLLQFQPRARLGSGRITGAEALPLWQPTAAPAMSSSELLHLAEETGLDAQLGRWLLGAACRQAAAWPRSRQQAGTMAVKLTRRQLRDRAIAAMVEQALQEAGLETQRLELHIAESLFLDPQCMPAVGALRKLGTRIAIDDFGTGYSSLGCLRQFPVDVLKIGETFVSELGTDPRHLALTAAVIALAQKLGCTTVADGVQHDAQRDLLFSMGCDEFQGPLVHVPCSEQALLGLPQA